IGDEFVAPADTQGVSFFGKGDAVLFAVREPANNDAREPIVALEPHKPVAQYADIENNRAGTMRNKITPIHSLRCGKWRKRNFEILAVVRIGLNDERFFAVERGMMLDIIAD